MAEPDKTSIPTDKMPVTGLVPMLSVLNVERSVEFYELLGFVVGHRVPREGPMNWAWLFAPNAPDWRRGPNLMLNRSEGAVGPAVRGVLFYFYATDLVALRGELARAGRNPGSIKYPEYLPKGELAIQDPDGYCLMLAQSDHDTP